MMESIDAMSKCVRCGKDFAVGVSAEVCNYCLGCEKGNPIPVALPLGYSHPPTIQEMIDASIRAASRAAGDEGYDTLEDADEFGEDEDRHELPDNSKYTMMEDDQPYHVLKDREKKALDLEKEERKNKEKRSADAVPGRRSKDFIPERIGQDRRSKFREPSVNRRERRRAQVDT